MRTARRTHGFTESVIRGMTRLANEHGAINLSQGFPNFPCPDVLKDAAARAIRDDVNQYAITWGAARLRNALAAKYQDWYGLPRSTDAGHGDVRGHRGHGLRAARDRESG